MGLSASQMRYLALTARKSDLEQRQENLTYARLELSTKSSEISRKYSEGMNNKTIKISHLESNGSTSQTVWEELNFKNAMEQNYRVIGTDGEYLNPSPYCQYQQGSTLTAEEYKSLSDTQKANCTSNSDGTYTANASMSAVNPSYKGFDIQTILTSGQGMIVGEDFYQYLCQHGYGSGSYTDDEGNETTYQKLADTYTSLGNDTTIDWTSDVTSTFKEVLYTEDDEQVLADYESTTAELQEMDQRLELEQKNIETEHKEVETEYESTQKVVKDNIEKSYKSFSA